LMFMKMFAGIAKRYIETYSNMGIV